MSSLGPHLNLSRGFGKFPAAAFVALLLAMIPSRPALSRDNFPEPPRAANAAGQTQPLSVKEKLNLYVEDTYGPGAWLTAAAGAGIRQHLDSPPEWEQGMKGYGRRFVSSLGETAVKNTVQFAVGAALREDPRYFPSERRGIVRRSWHAMTFAWAPRHDSGGRVPGIARVAGALSSGFVSNAWYPERLSDTSHALSRAGIMLGGDAARNLFQEFWPDVRRAVFGR